MLERAQAAEERARAAEERARRVQGAAEAARSARLERLEKAWAAVSKVATTTEMPKGERVDALDTFLRVPDDNPHRETAEGYRARLKAGKEPSAAPEDMVEIPGGEFFMGCNEEVDSDCEDDEKPGRRVDVDPFFIDRTEVTVDAYAACVQAGACSDHHLTGYEWPGTIARVLPWDM
jgi:formylglycine-generating enzyme required for sulfatase activity